MNCKNFRVTFPASTTWPSAMTMLEKNAIPYLTTDQMREVDRAMIEDYHIELIQMMENAGRNLAHLARTRFLDGDPRGRRVVVRELTSRSRVTLSNRPPPVSAISRFPSWSRASPRGEVSPSTTTSTTIPS